MRELRRGVAGDCCGRAGGDRGAGAGLTGGDSSPGSTSYTSLRCSGGVLKPWHGGEALSTGGAAGVSRLGVSGGAGWTGGVTGCTGVTGRGGVASCDGSLGATGGGCDEAMGFTGGLAGAGGNWIGFCPRSAIFGPGTGGELRNGMYRRRYFLFLNVTRPDPSTRTRY